MFNIGQSNAFILTADVGGSHITSSVCHLQTSTLLQDSVTREEFNSKDSANHILSAWGNCLSKSLRKADVAISGVGLAMPGPFDYESGVCYIKGLNKYEALYGMDVRDALSKTLTIPPQSFKFRNDAEAAIAGEWSYGAGKGYQKIIGVTLGTGFGSALTQNGVTVDLNLGSEKFRDSIADDYLSTRWFLSRYHEYSGITLSGVKELAMEAASSCAAKSIFSEFATNMAAFLKPYIDCYQPDALLICGNIAKSHQLFDDELQRLIRVPVLVSRLWDCGALLGMLAMFAN